MRACIRFPGLLYLQRGRKEGKTDESGQSAREHIEMHRGDGYAVFFFSMAHYGNMRPEM